MELVMSFDRILEKYRKISFSEHDKGDRFERLMQTYLQTDPKYAYRFKNVWLWNKFPGKFDLGGKDTGIDLVALTHEGDYWAIQCKCFQEDSVIDKPAVDTFLSTSSREFKSEQLAEKETNGKGVVLFLVPSISLLGQILREWITFAKEPINPICICSDPKVSNKKTKNDENDSFSVVDLALPASTNVKDIIHQFKLLNYNGKKGMTVVFSTYQSIEVISKTQKALRKDDPKLDEFDLIICDEAHRTTGVTLSDEDESAFTKVHDNDFIKAKKRLYMTATPRLYSDDIKSKAAQMDAVLCSMDDEKLYGQEIYRIGFGKAVEQDLLSDYKVLILTLSDKDVPPAVQKMVADKESEINADDASKLIGCITSGKGWKYGLPSQGEIEIENFFRLRQGLRRDRQALRQTQDRQGV
jgi:predicted helicase